MSHYETAKCNDSSMSQNLVDELFRSQCALQVAFQTMKERCQQLRTRLAAVEEENVCLRLECGKDTSSAVVRANDHNGKTVIQMLQEKVEELIKQKQQLTHHVCMVAAENRQLWNRLTRLTRTNKSLGNQLTKISDTLKQHNTSQPLDISLYNFKDISDLVKGESDDKCSLPMDNDNKDQSLEEISLRLINSIMLEKSELEQQYAEMVEMQSGSDINLQNIGLTYPEDMETDSLEQLKQHDIRLSQTKDALLVQQEKLKTAIENLKKLKNEVTCKNCRKNARKKMCQIGTQFDSDDSLREHGSTQTSLLPFTNLVSDSCQNSAYSNKELDQKICPLCGIVYGTSTSFETFHEHVVNHFVKEESLNGFELMH